MKQFLWSLITLSTLLVSFGVIAQTGSVAVRELQTGALQYNSGDVISGEFTLSNLSQESQTDLYYVLRGGVFSEGILDEVFTEEERFGPISLKPNEEKVMDYSFSILTEFGAQEGIQIELQRRDGEAIGLQSIPVNIVGDESVSAKSKIRNGVEVEFLERGIFFESGEEYELGLILEGTTIDLGITAESKDSQVFVYSQYRDVIGGDLVSTTEVVVQNEKITLSLGDTPGKYVTRLETKDGQDFYDMSFVIEGVSASIASIQSSTPSLKKDDSLRIDVLYYGGSYQNLEGSLSDELLYRTEPQDNPEISQENSEDREPSIIRVSDSSGSLNQKVAPDQIFGALPVLAQMIVKVSDLKGESLFQGMKEITLTDSTDQASFSFVTERKSRGITVAVEVLDLQGTQLTKADLILEEENSPMSLQVLVAWIIALLVFLFVVFMVMIQFKKEKKKDGLAALVVAILLFSGINVLANDGYAMQDVSCTLEETQKRGCQEVYELPRSEWPPIQDRISFWDMNQLAVDACRDAGYEETLQRLPTFWIPQGTWYGVTDIICTRPVDCATNLCQYQQGPDAPYTKVIESTTDLLRSENSSSESVDGSCHTWYGCSHTSPNPDQIISNDTNRTNLCNLAGYREYSSYTETNQTSTRASSFLNNGITWNKSNSQFSYVNEFQEIREVTVGQGNLNCNLNLPSSCTVSTVGGTCYSLEANGVRLVDIPNCTLDKASYNSGDDLTMTCTELPSGTEISMSDAVCSTEDAGSIVCTGISGDERGQVNESDLNRLNVDYGGSYGAIYGCNEVPNGTRVVDTLTCANPVIDACTNIDGYQPVAPEGYVQDADGTCRLTDVCPNTVAVETEIPAGYVLDSGGNCVLEPAGCDDSHTEGELVCQNGLEYAWTCKVSGSEQSGQGTSDDVCTPDDTETQYVPDSSTNLLDRSSIVTMAYLYDEPSGICDNREGVYWEGETICTSPDTLGGSYENWTFKDDITCEDDTYRYRSGDFVGYTNNCVDDGDTYRARIYEVIREDKMCLPEDGSITEDQNTVSTLREWLLEPTGDICPNGLSCVGPLTAEVGETVTFTVSHSTDDIAFDPDNQSIDWNGGDEISDFIIDQTFSTTFDTIGSVSILVTLTSGTYTASETCTLIVEEDDDGGGGGDPGDDSCNPAVETCPRSTCSLDEGNTCTNPCLGGSTISGTIQCDGSCGGFTDTCPMVSSERECVLSDGTRVPISLDQHNNLQSGDEFVVGTSRYNMEAQRGGADRECALVSNAPGLTLTTTPGLIEPGDYCQIGIVAGGVSSCSVSLTNGTFIDGSLCTTGDGSKTNPCVLSAPDLTTDPSGSITFGGLSTAETSNEGKVSITDKSILVDVSCDLLTEADPLEAEAVCSRTPNIGEF